MLCLALILSCLSQSLPVAAYQARPWGGSQEGPEAAYATTVDALPGAGPVARVIGPAEGAGTLSEESLIEGIHVYSQSNVDCAFPQYPEGTPSCGAYSTTGGAPGMVGCDRYICSTGAWVHISLWADAEGTGFNIAESYLRCYGAGCSPKIEPGTVPVFGQGPWCNGIRSQYEGNVYLPAGEYWMHAQAGFNTPGCANDHAEVAISVSAPWPDDDRWLGLDTCPDTTPGQAYTDKPVNTRTGNFTYSNVDFSIPTRGLPLDFERTYNSRDTAGGPLGVGWTHNYAQRLIIGTDTIKYVARHGSRLPFYRKSDGSYRPGPGVRDDLVKNGDGTYTLTRPDRVALHFNANGRLTLLEDIHGNATTLTYTGNNLTTVAAPDGRALTLAYDGDGHITDVTDPLSRTVHYTYTAGALTAFTDPLGQVWEYGYNAQGRMTTFTEGGSGTTTNVYDSQGRVVTQRDALQQEMTFAYSANHTVVTDAAGVPVTYTYSAKGVLTAVTDDLGHRTSYERDDDYNVTAVTDALNHTTHYTWNDCGCAVTSVRDALHNTTTKTYDDHNNLLSVTDPLTHTARFAYDAGDDLVAVTNTLGYTSTFAYDARGQMVAATDPRGHASALGYDDYGNLVAITDTLGQVTALAYDPVGRVTAVTDAREHSTALAYDALGRVITITGALSGQGVLTYDAAGHLTGLIDANGHATAFAYDALGRLITITDALEGETIFAYDPVGRVTAATDANGRTTQLAYDAVGQLITATDALNGRTVLAYDAVGNVTRVTNAAGKPTTFAYDALNRTVAITDALGHATWLGYDALGNVTYATDPTGVLVEYGYDEASQLLDVTGPLGPLASFTYDPIGNLQALTDANGHTTHYAYDDLNRLQSVLDPLDGLASYTYDPVGNLETVTDARNNVTQYTYDALDRLQSVTDPLEHVTAFGYDAVGNTAVITDADLGVTAVTYDALDRLVRVDYPDSTVEYGYDAVGNRLAMTDTTGVTTYEYDALYRPLTTTAPYAGAVGYRYDGLGRRTETLYPGGGSVAYTYDDASRLTQVTDWASGVTTYTYDSAGRVVGAQLPNGVETGYEYDTAGRLTAIQHERGEGWQTRYEYGLDAAGNRVAVTETTTAVRAYGLPRLGRAEGTGGSGLGAGASSVGGWPLGQKISYSYDDADRLTDAQYDSSDRYEYAYDTVGNRTTLTVTAQAVEETSTSYAYDDADRLTSVDGIACRYDNRGNLTSDGTWTYTYDGAGRMVRAASITATMVYTYNGDGLLVAEAQDGIETRFTWDQALALPQVLGTSGGERDVYGLERIGVVEGDAWYYPQSDALGSVRQWTDPAGAVLGLQAYGPYGETLAPLGTPLAPWGYTGEWQDPAGLVYLRARWYNPVLGRFTQVDPFAGLLGAPATQHPYAYVLNGPLNGNDPTGEFLGALAVTVGVGAAIGAIGGGISYVIRNPGHSLSGYVHDPAFWRSVGSGAVAGAVAGLVVWALPEATTFWGAVGVGAASGAAAGAAGRITENLLTPCARWYEGLPEAILVGGIAGGVIGGLAYGLGWLLRSAMQQPTLQEQLQRIAQQVGQRVPGRGPVAGTLKHTAFREEVNALGLEGIHTEVSFLDRGIVPYGTRGSVRLDVVDMTIDDSGKPVIRAVYDLKTGIAKLTQQRIQQILAQLPNSAPVIPISP